ncbi:MAG: hypothetical protein ACI4TU_01220 [Candidatus Cryptobacteroides sp.]
MKRYFALFFGLFIALSSFGQELPKFPSDPAVKHGTLPNGISWYITSNSSAKSMADFALVQKCGLKSTAKCNDPVLTARESLSSLAHIPNPQKFLTDRGIAPGEHGYVQVTDDATIYRFSNVLLYDEKAVLDSTLLMIFDIIGRAERFPDSSRASLYSPSDQAIVISGDINVDDVVKKMNYMSLMVNSLPSDGEIPYQWKSAEGPLFKVESSDKASVSVSWRMPRHTRDNMNTIQPVIFHMMLDELGNVVEQGVESRLSSRGIPCAGVEWSYLPSSDSAADEEFTVSVPSQTDCLPDVLTTLAGTFATIRSGNTALWEISLARRKGMDSLFGLTVNPLKSNSESVERCIKAFLRNSSLASYKETYNFYTSRNIPDTTELRLFNNVVKALVSDIDNMTVTCKSPDKGFTAEMARTLFEKAWNNEEKPLAGPCGTAVSAEPEPYMEKFRLSSTRTDGQSKSTMWTFSNGFTVVYKKMETSGKMFYTLAQRGGYGSIPGLVQGEGGFFSDYPYLSCINGCPGEDFFNTLKMEGIEMTPTVSLSHLRLSGVTSEEKVPVMLNALVSFFNNMEKDTQLAEQYMASQRLRDEFAPIDYKAEAAMEDILCPDNILTPYKKASVLDESFFDKADQYFKKQSKKMDDGLLVLVGDMDEVELRKILTSYVCHFKTAGRTFQRESFRYQTISGTSLYTIDGECDMIDILMSSPYPLTADNVITAQIAGLVMQRRLSETLAKSGMYADVSAEVFIYPQERARMRLKIGMADASGFALDNQPCEPLRALSMIRSCIGDIGKQAIGDKELAACKKNIKGRLETQMKDPQWWMEILTRRYMDGKDLYTNLLSKVDGVSSQKVSDLLDKLARGSRVEYLIKDSNK